MFEYTFPAIDNLHIETPKVNDFSEVEVLKNDSTSYPAHTIYKYPNGVIFETLMYLDKVVVRCSNEIIDNGNGTFKVV